MKTLKNILVGSLVSMFAFVSAQAGELTVSGGMEISKTVLGNQETGNGLGQDTELSFTGSTELDNGMSVSYKQTVTDAMGFNDSELVFGTDYGTIAMRSTGGTIEDIDNIVPTAFEEAEALWPSSSGWNDVGTNDGTYGITYKNALLNTGMDVTAYYTPKGETGDGANDDSVSGASTNADNGKAVSIYLRGNPLNYVDGLDVALGWEQTDTKGARNIQTDIENYTAAINYTYGPVKVGFQKGFHGTGLQGATAVEGYLNTYAGIAYAINDSLTVSYQDVTSKRHSNTGDNIVTEVEGFSAAYTMGGMTIAYVQNDADNANYSRGTDRSASQINISVAF